jgi:Stress responsive A/B Barrel Domain
MKYTFALGLLALISLASCQSTQNAESSQSLKPNQPPQVEHVVLLWLKNPADTVGRQRIIDASKTFTQIPGVLSVSVGKAIPGQSPAIDSTFDVGIVIRFKNHQALLDYNPHPIHKKAADEILIPQIKSIKVYDVECQ